MKFLMTIISLALLASCSKEASTPEPAETTPGPQKEAAPIAEKATSVSNTEALAAILDVQSDEAKARYPFRRPQETLELFTIEPGMTVAEVLPGGGWYSKILIPYLGESGQLIGISYPFSLAEELFPPSFQEFFKTFTTVWPQQMQESGVSGASVSAYEFSALPETLNGTVDRVVFIRALHHLNRAEGYLSSAVAESFAMLKPGGRVGIVQHEAPESAADDTTKGDRGYVKKSDMIAAFEQAGFVLVEDSPLNNNAKDVPSDTDKVWRLPPSLRVEGDDEALKAEMAAIGESNRMTLVFEKPAS